ncbi:MAG: nitroreductase family protein [Acidobacteria bacterium]|jgi:nitroreductase|nr:nitroreductase family protein [Acidobacteriota bacterium]
MYENITPECSAALDAIIRERRSVRVFSSIQPDRKDIEAIIQAGLLSPFPALAVAGKPDFRKVFVIQNSSLVMKAAADIIKNRTAKIADELEKKVGQVPFVMTLKRAGKEGIPGVGNAPYFVVVGERKGIPAVAAQSLSFCLQNMWLKATSLGIGFQLVSAVIQMENDPDFCKLLNLACGEYALDGCALGYPAENYQPPSVQYPTLTKSVTWL